MNAPVRKITAGLAGLAAVAGLTVATAPSAQAAGQGTAAVQAGTVWEIWNNYNGQFLDSDSDGNVYTLPRNNSNYQLWAERANNRRSNAATGRCLQDTGISDAAKTYPCSSGSTTQEWVHESHPGGVVIKNLSILPEMCLTSGDELYNNNPGARKVEVVPCAADKRQLWSVKAVF